MLKKRNLILLSLLILVVLLVTSCLPKPPVTEGILKGQVMVPEGTLLTKDLTGQVLPDATVNIIDLSSGEIIASTTTDASGYYQVFVPAGGPYLLQAIKDGMKVQQFTPQVEVGIEYDLGTADCATTAAALIAQAMIDAGNNPTDIDCAAIQADSNFNNVSSIVCSIIKAGGDPTASTLVQQAVEDFLYPPAPTPTYTVTFDTQGGSVVNSQTVAHGGKVTEPTVPTRTGYAFGNWHKESGCTNAWNFGSDTVTANVTLYAKWTIAYTVNFDSQGGSAVNSQSVQYGGKVTEPTVPTRTGYAFGNWYKESGCTNAWNFGSDTVTANVTLYAKWMDPVNNITKGTYYTAIQAALTAADSGDIIEVADGTYNESIIFPDGKLITLRSLYGPPSTSITGVDGSATVTCSNCSEGTTLEGFTIHHESGDSGNGIAIDAGYLTIKNCTISNNSSIIGAGDDHFGGGIFNSLGTLTITSSTISGNSATLPIVGFGGGIWNHGPLTITGSTISNNSGANGGGIQNYYGTLTITRSTITGNSITVSSTDTNAGGIASSSGTLTITGSTISNNSGANGCGGIVSWGDTTVVIGGSSDADTDNFNNFIDNYNQGSAPSADQHIHNPSVDCHWDYLNNYYSPAEVATYKFEASKNDALSADIEGDINPTERIISLTVPSGTDLTGLKATFALVSGASAKVGTTSQESGTTTNNFSSPVDYVVFKTTEPSKVTNWTVTVSVASP